MIVRLALLFSLCCLCIFRHNVYSQNIDSLQLRLLHEKADTSIVDLLLDISFEYRNSIPDSTIYYAREALIQANEVSYLGGEVLALRNIGLGYQKKGNYDSCIVYLKRAIERTGGARISALGDAYNTLGTTYFFKGQYDSAISYFEKGADIFEEFGEWNNQAGNFANIGVIAETRGNSLQALEYYQKALTIFEREKSSSGIAGVRSNMGSILEDQGKYDEALQMYIAVLKNDQENKNLLGAAISTGAIAGIKEKLGRSEEAMDDYRKSLHLFLAAEARCRASLALNNIGELHLAQHSLDSAKYYFMQALAGSDSCKIPDNEVTSRLDLGEYYIQKKQPNKAENEYLLAYDIAKEMGLQKDLAEASHHLYLIHKEAGEVQEALGYLEIYLETSKELYNEKNARKIERMQAEYEFRKEKEKLEYDNQIRGLTFQKELSDERLTRNTILVILVIVILLVIMLTLMYFQRVRSSRQLDRINREILMQKRELSHMNNELVELNDEKNTLIGIVAHDLKGPINQIRGLLQLVQMEEDSKNMKEYLVMMDESSARSVEMIERILDINAIENKKLEVKSIEVDLSTLVHQVIAGFDSAVKEKNITVVYDTRVSNSEILTDPLLLREIINNLVSNAIKFSPSNTTIQIATEKKESYYIIKIKDEGPGMSEEDQLHMFNKYQQVTAKPTGNEKSTGLGLAIVKKYADELGYHIECESEEAVGTEFRVILGR